MKRCAVAGAALCLLLAAGCASTSQVVGTPADPAKLAAAVIVPPAMSRTIAGNKLDFAKVPAGSFQRDANRNNITVITRPYYMMITEVTQELFQAVMGTNPSSPLSKREPDAAIRPVNNITWYTAIAFCNKLSLLDGKKPVYTVQGVSDWAGLSYSRIPLY
ncbi:MAG: formylglycine-generating enzyme family protein, partial [Treponema sp.]|nr:formylglycine-generating enzyme family protein [Treponema sp.]